MTDTNKKIHICPILQILWYAKKNPRMYGTLYIFSFISIEWSFKKKINVHVYVSLYSNVLERVWNYQKVLGTMFKLNWTCPGAMYFGVMFSIKLFITLRTMTAITWYLDVPHVQCLWFSVIKCFRSINHCLIASSLWYIG